MTHCLVYRSAAARRWTSFPVRTRDEERKAAYWRKKEQENNERAEREAVQRCIDLTPTPQRRPARRIPRGARLPTPCVTSAEPEAIFDEFTATGPSVFSISLDSYLPSRPSILGRLPPEASNPPRPPVSPETPRKDAASDESVRRSGRRGSVDVEIEMKPGPVGQPGDDTSRLIDSSVALLLTVCPTLLALGDDTDMDWKDAQSLPRFTESPTTATSPPRPSDQKRTKEQAELDALTAVMTSEFQKMEIAQIHWRVAKRMRLELIEAFENLTVEDTSDTSSCDMCE